MHYNLMQILSEIQDVRRESQIDYSLSQILDLVIIIAVQSFSLSKIHLVF